MGTDWEVWAWQRIDPLAAQSDYHYVQVYGGNAWWVAVLAAVRAKRSTGCVKVEWRG